MNDDILSEKMPDDLAFLFDQLGERDEAGQLWNEWHDFAQQNEEYAKEFSQQTKAEKDISKDFKENKSRITPAEQMKYYNSVIWSKIVDKIHFKYHEQTKDPKAKEEQKEERKEEKRNSDINKDDQSSVGKDRPEAIYNPDFRNRLDNYYHGEDNNRDMPPELVELMHQMKDTDKFSQLYEKWHQLAALNQKYEKVYPQQYGNLVEGNLKFKEEKKIPTPAEQMRQYTNMIREEVEQSLGMEQEGKEQNYELDDKEELGDVDNSQVQDKDTDMLPSWMTDYFDMQEREEDSYDSPDLENDRDDRDMEAEPEID